MVGQRPGPGGGSDVRYSNMGKIMKIMNRKALTLGAIALACVAAPAAAGTAVHGYGDTRAQAVRDATSAVKEASQERFQRRDCYTPVRPQDCRQDGGGWVCVAYVANHAGSCGR